MTVRPDILHKLRAHQVEPAARLLKIVSSHNSGIDMSATGVGKSYVAMAVAASLNLPTLVICPKIMITTWHRVAAHFNDKVSVIGYEKLRTGKTAYGKWISRKQFRFSSQIQLIIFDECHRCGSLKSLNSEMLIAAKQQGIKTLLLSATPATSPLQLRAIGYALDLHNLTNYYRWSTGYGCKRHPVFKGWHWLVSAERQKQIMADISAKLIPERGVRVTTESIPDFPERSVEAVCYDLDNSGKLDEYYVEMQSALTQWGLRKQHDKTPDNPLVIQLRARQKVELLKVPIFAELIEDCLAKGIPVAVFVNFRQTLDELRHRFDCACSIYGDQSPDERQSSTDSFQRGISRIILVMASAGGVGVSLHSTTDNTVRVGLVSPSFSAQELTQVCGRLHRAGGSRCIYKIVFVANSIEERVQRAVQTKLNNLEALTDGELIP